MRLQQFPDETLYGFIALLRQNPEALDHCNWHIVNDQILCHCPQLQLRS